MVIEDFVMLGRTEPCDSKKYGKSVCSAGYSRELGQFIRIYPLMVYAKVPRWSVCRVHVERSKHDSRTESWKLKDEGSIEVYGKTDRLTEIEYLSGRCATSIAACNNRKESLAVISPSRLRSRFGGMKVNEDATIDMFPETVTAKRVPRLLFDDEDGPHDLQLLDWGSMEFLRKHGANEHHKLWGALRLNDDQYSHRLFVGNHNCHRNSWLVISLLSVRESRQQMLF